MEFVRFKRYNQRMIHVDSSDTNKPLIQIDRMNKINIPSFVYADLKR